VVCCTALANVTTGSAYEFEQVAKIDILRKLKQRFGRKVIRDACLPGS
jgi:hypothetical protein